MGTELTAEQVRELRAFVDRHGYLSWLGVTLEAVERGRLAMSVPYDGKLVNPAPETTGAVHGGIAATLVDTASGARRERREGLDVESGEERPASGFVLRTTFDDPADAALTTTDLNVSYLRPATGDLFAEAEVVRAGESMGVTRVTVESQGSDGDRTEVAVGDATHRLFREGAP